MFSLHHGPHIKLVPQKDSSADKSDKIKTNKKIEDTWYTLEETEK